MTTVGPIRDVSIPHVPHKDKAKTHAIHEKVKLVKEQTLIEESHVKKSEVKDKAAIYKKAIEKENKLVAVKENVSELGKTFKYPNKMSKNVLETKDEFQKLLNIVESRDKGGKSVHAKWDPILNEGAELNTQIVAELSNSNMHFLAEVSNFYETVRVAVNEDLDKTTHAREEASGALLTAKIKSGKMSHEEILEKLYLQEDLDEIAEMLHQPGLEKSETKSLFFDMCNVVWSEVEKYESHNESIPHNLSALKKMGEDIRDEFFGLKRDHDLDKVKDSVSKFHAELNKLNHLELNYISEDTIALAKEKTKEQYHLDPEQLKIYIQKFGPYVSAELKREAAENMVNQLIALGTEGFGIKDANVDDLSDVDAEILNLVGRYEKKRNEKIPFLAPHELKDLSIDETVTLKSHTDKTKSNFKVEVKQDSDGHWVVNIKDNDNPKSKPATFTSSEYGHAGYIQASAYAHAYLDNIFYQESGLRDELNRIAQGLGITAQTLQLLGNMKDLIPRRGGSSIATQTTLISSVSDPLKAAEMVGVVGDIVGVSLIIPSILEAMKANKVRQEQNELQVTRYQKFREREQHLYEIRQIYENETGNKLSLTRTELTELQAALKSMARNDNVIAMEQHLDAVLKIGNEINLINEQDKGLTNVILEKSGAVTSNIMASLGYGVKAGITLQHLLAAPGIEMAGAAASACVTLGAFASGMLAVGGAIQLGFDARHVHKAVCKKDALTNAMNNILKSDLVISDETVSFLQEINKMERRMINSKIASNSLGIASDVFVIGVGATALASTIVGAATMGAGVIVIPAAAGTAVAGKLAYEAWKKVQTDKTQKHHMKHNPEKSDIGKIARLNLLLRSEDSEAKLIGKELIEGYYGMSPEVFIEITNGVVDKYHELQKNAHMTDMLK